jgi:hypothetical protein
MSSLIMVSERRLMFGNNSLMLIIACALLWAMTLPEAPQGLINSQQTMLTLSTLVTGSSSQDGPLESFF